MNKAIDYRKYQGKGRPRATDYKRSAVPFEHEAYEEPGFDWFMAFVVGLMLATALGAFVTII